MTWTEKVAVEMWGNAWIQDTLGTKDKYLERRKTSGQQDKGQVPHPLRLSCPSETGELSENVQFSEVTGVGRKELWQEAVHVQSSIKEGGESSYIWPLRAEH